MNETPDGTQQPEPPQDPQELRLDARTLRGLAHPLRVRILGMLRRDGAATATGLAEKLGQSSAATSYHLRQLAEYGFIVEVAELGQGRERYWKSASRSTTLDVGAYVSDPELAANTETYLRAVTRMSADLVQSHLDEKVALPGHWQSAGTFNDTKLRLTPAQADELAERMWALVDEYPRADELAPPADDDTDPGEALRPVDVQLNIFPVPGRRAMSQTTASAPPTRGSLRPMIALLTAYGISLVGTRLSMIALPLFVLATTGSPTRTGFVAMAEMAPYVLAQALSGPVTDRVGPRRMSITSDLVSVVVVGLIPVLHHAGMLHFSTLVALVALAGAVRGPGDSAKYVLAPAVAKAAGQPNERVLGLEDGIGRASNVLGPLAAAALVTLVGAPAAIALDALTFAVAALVFVVALRPSEAREAAPAAPADDDAEPYLARLRAGARFVWDDGLLRAIVGMVAVTNMVDAALSGVLIAVWAQHRGGGAGLMGATAAVMSVGALCGALFAAAAGHRLPRRLAFAVGFFGIGAPRFAVLGLDAPLWLVFAVLFVGGLGCGLINPILGAVQMERVPEAMRARVMSLINAACWCLIPFGGVLGGVLATKFGISAALLVCGAIYLVATTLPLVRPEWAQMNRRAADPEPDPETDVQDAQAPEMADHGVTFDAPAR